MRRAWCILWEWLGLVWRESPAGDRVSARTAWTIAVLYHTDGRKIKHHSYLYNLFY